MPAHWRIRDDARDHVLGSGPLSHRLRKLSPLERLDEARAYLETFTRARGSGRSEFQKRWATIRQDLLRHGFYQHTQEELEFGAKLAWRNHARCIGRLFWDSLEVRDRRQVTGPHAVFQDLCEHLSMATNDGRIRSVISVYPPMQNGSIPSYIESPQLIRYAGYLDEKRRVIGDRKAIDAARIACALGWQPPVKPGPFDVLPVIIRDENEQRHWFELPEHAVRQVAIRHPDHAGLEDLRLRWYAVPVVSDMILTIGGIDYPCAPFNGFYMCTEIASRNLADRGRYDLLPDVARCFGLDPEAGGPLWRDTALTELNRAVLHSFQSAGVTIVDHHLASDQFMRFLAREKAAGRQVSADWAWIVPPQASSACEVFHLEMTDLRAVPNFYRSRASDGLDLGPQTDRIRNSRLRNCLHAATSQMFRTRRHG